MSCEIRDHVTIYVNAYRRYQDSCAELEELEQAAIQQLEQFSAGWDKARVKHDHGNYIARVRTSRKGRKFLRVTDQTRDYRYQKFSRQ